MAPSASVELTSPMNHRWNCGCLVKFGFLAGYGAVASVITALYNNPKEGDPNFFMLRLLAGAVIFPLSRHALQFVYYTATSRKANNIAVSGISGCLCGFLFCNRDFHGEDGLDIFVSVAGFAAGAILVDFLL